MASTNTYELTLRWESEHDDIAACLAYELCMALKPSIDLTWAINPRIWSFSNDSGTVPDDTYGKAATYIKDAAYHFVHMYTRADARSVYSDARIDERISNGEHVMADLARQFATVDPSLLPELREQYWRMAGAVEALRHLVGPPAK